MKKIYADGSSSVFPTHETSGHVGLKRLPNLPVFLPFSLRHCTYITSGVSSLCNFHSYFLLSTQDLCCHWECHCAYPLWYIFVDQSSFGNSVAAAARLLRCQLFSLQEMWTNNTADFLIILFLFLCCYHSEGFWLPLPSLRETYGATHLHLLTCLNWDILLIPDWSYQP